jgi:catechol 2,3-dioxygenase-like lactoylglutathione lyase family enzyme
MPDRFDHVTIAAADFEASLRFYREILGWQVIEEQRTADGMHTAQLSSGAIRIILTGYKRTSGEAVAAIQSSPHAPVLHLDIHDADARFARIPPGDHVVVPPTSNHAGLRCFTLRDPDGNLLTFIEMRQRAQR